MAILNTTSVNFSRSVTTTTPTTLGVEYRCFADANDPNKQHVQQWVSLDPNAVSQVDTITITPGVAGDLYSIAIAVGSATSEYICRQTANDTGATLATFLASVINSNQSVTATANNNVVKIVSAVPGQAFTCTASNSTSPANLVVAHQTANAGDGTKLRLIWNATIAFVMGQSSQETLSVSGNGYDGTANANSIQSFGPVQLAIGQRSLSQYVAAAIAEQAPASTSSSGGSSGTGTTTTTAAASGT